MFRPAQPSARRAASFTLSVLIHLLFFLLFPHLSSVFQGEVAGEGSLGGGAPLDIVTVQPWAVDASVIVPSPGLGKTPGSSPNSQRPAPGPAPARPVRPQEELTPPSASSRTLLPAAVTSSAEPTAALTPMTAKNPPPAADELLTSPTGKVLVRAEPTPAAAVQPRSETPQPAQPGSDSSAGPSGATPSSSQAVQGQKEQGGEGEGGTSPVPAPPPAPPVGNGPWLGGPAPQYPKSAQNSGVEGVVSGQVLIYPDGATTVRLVSSSGSAILDRQAVGTIQDRWRSTYQPPAGWVTVVEWQVRFARENEYQVLVTQSGAFNVREEAVPAQGPVPRPAPSSPTPAGTGR
ncbi:MAG: TonB family protein [Limnochordaceae bacterium]|nr:TonB family protein [Limnochordaceae bacterium]